MYKKEASKTKEKRRKCIRKKKTLKPKKKKIMYSELQKSRRECIQNQKEREENVSEAKKRIYPKPMKSECIQEYPEATEHNV